MSREHRINLQDAENHFGRRRFVQKIIERSKPAKSEPKWVQKDGHTVFVKNMTDSHIKNSINMLKRNIELIDYNDMIFGGSFDISDYTPSPYENLRQNYEDYINIFKLELSKRKKLKK